jgi:glycolate oxidase
VTLHGPAYRHTAFRPTSLRARQQVSWGPGRVTLEIPDDGHAWLMVFDAPSPVSAFDYRPTSLLELPASVPDRAASPVIDVHAHLALGPQGTKALPSKGGMVILTTDLDRILETDFEEGWIRCEPGVVLTTVQRLAAASGWRYVPDPSSHQVCTIGGNVAENAGGPHALGGGPTSNDVSALELVQPHGVVSLDSQQPWRGGLDLRALLVGSEGTLGAVASVTLRLVRAPESEAIILATFAHQQDALSAVLGVLDSGPLPRAMDMLTGGFIPGRRDYVDDSLLFISLQGYHEEVSDQAARLRAIVRSCDGLDELLAPGEFLARRARLVNAKVRNMTIASGRPRYYLFDAVAPRSRLADLMAAIRRASTEYGLPVLNTFHAGDGNVHPTPFYDPADADHRERLLAFSADVLRQCQRLGGSLSGEHGIGLEAG